MEAFRPDLAEGRDLILSDLDTRVIDSVADIAGIKKLTTLRDFYHRGKKERQQWIGSGLMYLPAESRGSVWDRYIADAKGHMARHSGGDQKFLEEVWKDTPVAKWQDELPGQVVSYKVHVEPSGQVPAGARIVCFHGTPRPWDKNVKGLPWPPAA